MASATCGDQLGGLAGRQRSLGQPLGEALPLDEAHREVMLALVLADLEDRHDARMVEVGRRLGLGVEALDVGLVGELAGEDHLERDGAVEADLPGLEDDAHAAAGDLADDLVVAEVADAGGFGRAGCGRWILPEHRGGGLIVGRLGLVARRIAHRRHGVVLMDYIGRRSRTTVGCGPNGTNVGASETMDCGRTPWAFGPSRLSLGCSLIFIASSAC